MMQGRAATVYGQARMRHEAAALGLTMPTDKVPQLIEAKGSDVAEAASRLAAAAPTAAGTATSEEGTATEESTSGEEVASGEGVVTSEEGATETTGESGFTPEEEAIYNREYEELLAAEGLTE
jgi:hypothetical protein